MYRTSVVVAGGRQWWFDVLERFLWLQVIYGGCLLWLQVDDGFVEDKYSETYANLSQRRPAFLDVAMLEVRTYVPCTDVGVSCSPRLYTGMAGALVVCFWYTAVKSLALEWLHLSPAQACCSHI